MVSTDYESTLLELAREYLEQGPGFAQESVVLREAVGRLGLRDDIREQQRLLTIWHDLFRTGVLSWGYDIDNPAQPFFHYAER